MVGTRRCRNTSARAVDAHISPSNADRTVGSNQLFRNGTLHPSGCSCSQNSRRRFRNVTWSFWQSVCPANKKAGQRNALPPMRGQIYSLTPRSRIAFPLRIIGRTSSLNGASSKSLSQRSGVIAGQSDPNSIFFFRIEFA